ncbi:hypothetical protein LPJ71_001138, partial [Coemansia sp. S17]
WFTERRLCRYCTINDYEDIVVNVPEDTVGHVKDVIAAKLGIEADEFVFGYKYDTTKYKYELDELFAKIYMRNNYLAYLLKGDIDQPFDIYLCENKDYTGKTGLLNWILRPKMDFHFNTKAAGGQLAKRLARHITAYKEYHNTLSTSSVPSAEANIALD